MTNIVKIFLVFFCAAILNGCCTVRNTAGGFSKGIWDDTKNTWNGIIKVDEWLKKNAW